MPASVSRLTAETQLTDSSVFMLQDSSKITRAGGLAVWLTGILCVTTTLLCAAIGLHSAWHWPLFGDEGIFHYIVFAMGHGDKPYVDLKDFNFPGTYFLDFVELHIIGAGAQAARMYDLTLCIVAGLGMWLCSERRYWPRVGALCAAALLTLFHLQDGLAQVGQRDFAVAALALVACGAFLRLSRSYLLSLFFFEAIVGLAFSVKPTIFLLFFLPIFVRQDEENAPDLMRVCMAGVSGILLAPALALIWLARNHAVLGFIQDIHELGSIHATLARKSLSFLLVHSVSPMISLVLVCLALAAWAAYKHTHVWSRSPGVLAFAALSGLVSYLCQGKGLSYQRYPFLGPLLLLCCLILTKMIEQKDRARYLSLAALVIFSFWFALQAAIKTASYEAVAPLEAALQTDLAAAQRLAPGKAQCLDTYSGCLTTLYNMRQTQNTGYLYDCYFFTPDSKTQQDYRAGFISAMTASLPGQIVITDQDCFAENAGFSRLDRWPQLATLLQAHYQLYASWQADRQYKLWSRSQKQPEFRIYILR
jgi:hypothetical protein